MLVTLVLASLTVPMATPSALPSPRPTPKEIGHVVGRAANLVGQSFAASAGTVSQSQLAARPMLRPGEVLEAIPGVVITQHSGEGKANQYYLRGFQLDHGTDLAGTIDGVPVNLPTHAHGQGYSDINWVIPELVDFVDYSKGPYYADRGDFSAAGSYDIYYRNTIAPTVELGEGLYGYDRLFLADSQALGPANLLYGVELYHDNGSFARPDEYRKLNGVLRWSKETAATAFTVSGWGYGGIFNSTDQIPERLVQAKAIGRFGSVDSSDGGQTSRYALSAVYRHQDPNGSTDFNAFAVQQYLDLFSNFTYYLDDATDYYNVHSNPVTCAVGFSTCVAGPHHVSTYTSYCPSNLTEAPFTFSCPDQREQLDRRLVTGFAFSRSFDTATSRTSFGFGTRNDNIPTVALFLTNDRIRYPSAALSNDHVAERDEEVWVQSIIHAGKKLRIVPGLRADQFFMDVHAPASADSGRVVPGILSPKLATAYEFSLSQEVYVDWGESFHSNDARGVTQTLDPLTHAAIDASGAPVQQVTPLVRAKGEEVGYRYSGSKLISTVALWQLDLNSELVFDGDHGTTGAGGPTKRYGIEFDNFWRPFRWLTVDADYAASSARFTEDTLQPGTFVPESLNEVIAAGVTIDEPHYSAGIRVRYFGPRTLDTQGNAVSASSSILNAQATAKLSARYGIRLEVLNVANARVDDVEYYYASWLPQDAARPIYAENPAVNPALGGSGVSDYVFHPAELRTFRLELAIHP
jgi:outer membrane receptor for Fe3+-dicitrate